MDEYPEYDFYNSGEACDGKGRRGEVRRGQEDENEKGGREEGQDRTRREVWLIKREEAEEKPYNKRCTKKKRR